MEDYYERKNEMVTVPSILNAMHTEGRQKESDRYKEQIHSYIKAHKLEMTETLKALVKIPSERTSAEENAPFGSSIARVLTYAKALYADNGFDTELDENGGFLHEKPQESRTLRF